jgi:acyl-coenzyme A thioesterase PaaI-like protein
MGQKEKHAAEAPPNKLPNSRHCFGCGIDNPFGLSMTFYETGANHVVSEFTVPEHFQGYPGVVHGGIVATMLDEIVGRVLVTDDPSRMMMTAKLVTRYRKPVPVGEPLKIEGWLIRDKGRYLQAKSEIRLADGSLAAEAEATLATVQEPPMNRAELEDAGWRVYPD